MFILYDESGLHSEIIQRVCEQFFLLFLLTKFFPSRYGTWLEINMVKEAVICMGSFGYSDFRLSRNLFKIWRFRNPEPSACPFVGILTFHIVKIVDPLLL